MHMYANLNHFLSIDIVTLVHRINLQLLEPAYYCVCIDIKIESRYPLSWSYWPWSFYSWASSHNFKFVLTPHNLSPPCIQVCYRSYLVGPPCCFMYYLFHVVSMTRTCWPDNINDLICTKLDMLSNKVTLAVLVPTLIFKSARRLDPENNKKKNGHLSEYSPGSNEGTWNIAMARENIKETWSMRARNRRLGDWVTSQRKDVQGVVLAIFRLGAPKVYCTSMS